MIALSRIAETSGYLPIDVFQNAKLWPPGTRWTINLEHASDDLRLHCTEASNSFKLEIVDMHLTITRVKVREVSPYVSARQH